MRRRTTRSYRTKEEVERPPVADHPCNLTGTPSRSLPAMKEAVFVNFLGYREPNPVRCMRCKGAATRRRAARAARPAHPTRLDKGCEYDDQVPAPGPGREGGVEGGGAGSTWPVAAAVSQARRSPASPSQCSPATCECECTEHLGPERESCLERSGYYWDERTCRAETDTKKISPRYGWRLAP